MRTACECLAVSMAPVISHGSAPVWMAGQAASVTKVMASWGLQTSELMCSHFDYNFKFISLHIQIFMCVKMRSRVKMEPPVS